MNATEKHALHLHKLRTLTGTGPCPKDRECPLCERVRRNVASGRTA